MEGVLVQQRWRNLQNVRSACFHIFLKKLKVFFLFSLKTEKENDLPPNIQETTSEPILYRDLNFLPKYTKPREVWIENFDSVKEEKRGLIQLHPEIFGTIPRLDLIHANMKWQSLYRKVVSVFCSFAQSWFKKTVTVTELFYI